ncbi:thiamine phosphate synthase [Bacillus sp. H-16]|uniref:thiamine phosphate synthase n=1 Tax=Alteribacter salitolerans TaxID=2912333 RepID=UPI0019637407|nr:thiamine phosphate synthase [Alteribacter salitolerans]MBM7095972.1 thiamine phosphate synthase [Alteribacter salitolerans]
MGRIDLTLLSDQLNVYFIAGSRDCTSPLPLVLNEAIAGGITMFQFREKGPGALEGQMKKALALQLFTQCKEADVPFIVNDDVELALQIDADGIHVGQEDEDAASVRKRIGKNKILGVSAHSVEEAYRAIEAGADYLGIGPIYETSSKDDAEEVKGPGWIRELRENGVDLPLVAIGGINTDNGSDVLHAGADGLSVISAISKAASPFEVARELKALFDQ